MERAGYGVINLTDAESAAGDVEAAARQAEIDRQTRLLRIGAVFTIPLTILSMSRHFMRQIPFVADAFPWLSARCLAFCFRRDGDTSGRIARPAIC